VKLYKAMGGIVIVGACLLVMSGVFKNDTHGARWVLGGIGWFGFLLCALTLIVLAVVALARLAHRRLTTV